MKTPSYEEEYLSNFDESLYEQEHLVAFGIIGDNVFKDIIVTEEKHDSATGIASVSITFKGAKDFKVDPTSTYINLFTKNGIVIMLDMISYNTSTQTVPLFSMGSPLPAYTSNGKTDCSLRCNVLGRRKIKPEDMTAIVTAGL